MMSRRQALATIEQTIAQARGEEARLDAALQALDLLAQRRQALERLMERRRAAAQAVKDREAAERHAKSAAPEEALKPIADLRQQVEAQVRASPAWAAQRAGIENAPAIADEAEKKPAQADADREAKRKPYETDPLVMYWRKKFGPAEDQSGPLVRFFDRRVARLVAYDKARAN